MKTLRFRSTLNLQAAGKARRFRILAYSGGLLPVDGFPVPVVVDLSGLEIPGAVPILIDHQPSVEATLGVTDDIINDGRQLVLAGPVTGTSATAQQVLAQAAAGHTWQASIGARVLEQVEIPTGQTVEVNGRVFAGPVIVARRAVLRETSVLPMGADATTQVNLAARAAALQGSNNMSFEDWCTALGVDAAALTPDGRQMLQDLFEAAQAEPEAAPTTAAAAAALNLRGAAASELRRHAEITALCAGYPHIAATAIEAGWTPMQAENAVLKASAIREGSRRVSNFGSGGRSDAAVTRDTLAAGLMLRAGAESAAIKAFGERTCQMARDQRLTNLVDVAAAALELSGRHRSEFNTQGEMLRAAFSTSSLPSILSDSTGKVLVEAYQETTSDWRKFCHVASAADFKAQKAIRPAAIAGLEQLGAGGVIKHGSIGEEDTYDWSVSTYAKMLSVTRQQLIDDDLGFLSELAPMLGVAAGRSLLDLIWSTILGGQTAGFFASGNLNLAEAGSALAVGTLGTGVSAMRSQRDSQGFDINIQPAVLAVPPALELTARNLLSSSEQLGTSGPNGNPVQGIVPSLVVEPRIANSTRFSGTSSTQWYLFGAPQTRPLIVGFLRGQQTPTVETADTDFNQLGVQMRCYFDYGVALGDEKAAYKATGAS